MALYFVTSSDRPESVLLVRAANGKRAMTLADGDECARVMETGEEGVLGTDGNPIGEERHEDADDAPVREVEITSLSDRGVRRYRNLDTGEERTQERE